MSLCVYLTLLVSYVRLALLCLVALEIRYLGDTTQSGSSVAPSLRVELSPWGMRLEMLQQDIALAALPTILHVQTVTIDLACPIPDPTADKAQGLGGEPLWMRFAETALAFPQLQHVELLRTPGPTGSTSPLPAPLGITDAAFKPLIEAGKFVCRYQGRGGRTMFVATDTVNPKASADRTTKAAMRDCDGGGPHVESEAVADRPLEDGHREYLVLD